MAGIVLGGAAGCQSAPAGPMPTMPPDAVMVEAEQTQFVESSVSAPAEQAFTLYFANHDAEPHNVHIMDASGTTVMQGEIFNGPYAQMDEVPALAPGTYSVVCDVHPGMQTELIVQ